MATLQEIRGRVEAVHFANPTFSAGRLRTPAGDAVPFAGRFFVRLQDAVVLHGSWERHPRFGRQFRVAHFTFDQPVGREGLAEYLAKHPRCKGIRPTRANRIALAFGDTFDQVIEREPERIAAVAQIPLAAAQTLREVWLETRALNAAMTWLSAFGLTHHQVATLIEKLGNSAVTALREDPFLLAGELPGFGFRRLDQIAQKVGTSKDHPSRLRAGLLHVVAERLDRGDCWVELQHLVEQANTLLALDVVGSRARIEQALDRLVAEDRLACLSLGGRFLIARPSIYQMERDLAGMIASAARAHPRAAELAADTLDFGLALSTGQEAAVLLAARHAMTLISGGAGTGKTTAVSAIATLYARHRLRVALAAPTGKAAQRLEQVVGKEAFTLHRLLGYDGRDFAHGPGCLLDLDAVVVDEMSMVDVELAWRLLRALDLNRTSVVFVGDHHQLPPVGPGNLLRDLLDRRPIPTVVLDQVLRQAGVLKENCSAILRGEVRPTAPADAGEPRPWIVLSRCTEIEAARGVLREVFETALVERLGYDLLSDVQVLTPTWKGPLGVDALNEELQRLVHRKVFGAEIPAPAPGRRPPLLPHDRVIQTRNNYALGVMNGSIGRVLTVGPRPGELRVRFESQEVDYAPDTDDAKDLALAFAITVHRAQGSEFPCVVAIVHKAHSFLHHRNLLYTAVTRAKRTAIVIGDAWGIRACAQREEVDRRKTFLSVLDLPRARP